MYIKRYFADIFPIYNTWLCLYYLMLIMVNCCCYRLPAGGVCLCIILLHAH